MNGWVGCRPSSRLGEGGMGGGTVQAKRVGPYVTHTMDISLTGFFSTSNSDLLTLTST